MKRQSQPRVSELLNGKIARKSVDKLLHYACPARALRCVRSLAFARDFGCGLDTRKAPQLGIVPKARFPQSNKEIVKRALGARGAAQSA